MKKIIFIVYFILLSSLAIAQYTKVTYKYNFYDSSMETFEVKESQLKNITPEQAKILQDMIRSESKVEFELIYNNTEGLFKKVKLLDVEEGNSLSQIVNKLYNNTYYKNLTSKTKLIKVENIGNYVVSIPFDEYKWKISTESKMISGHKCFKAETVKEDFYNPIKKSKATFYPIVWFAPDLPAQFGPIGLDGLPGLVLEATLGGKKYLYATKIEFDKNLKTNLSEKVTGKSINLKEYEDLLLKNYN
jgi:GLPGLI family protein